jgi:uncharacterized protein YprB with RNaseH-like and TPR domain
MDPLFERLKSLGLVQAVNIPAKKTAQPKKNLQEVIDGRVVENSQGACVLTSSVYPWDYQHGKVTFKRKSDFSLIAQAGKAREIRDEELSKLLFIDTETTGLAGGTGTFAFLVGMGYFSDNGFELKQFIIRDPTEESAMLLEIANLFESFSGIVSFNGKSFDLPLLKTRYLLNRMPLPFEEKSHLDLLFLSRKLWKNRLRSRALQDLEQEILDLPRTEEEVPGWMIPEIYFDYLRSGNPEPLKGVIYHNGMDIVSLAALFLYISDSFEHLSVDEEIHPIDYFSIGQVFFDLDLFDIAEKIFLDCITLPSLPDEMHLLSLKYTGALYKNQNNLEAALPLWQDASAMDDVDSSIELAKYYEHTAREYRSALDWTERACASLSKKGYHNYQDRQLIKEIEKRMERLTQKLEKENKNVSAKSS